MLVLTKKLSNTRPVNEENLLPRVILKNPAGKMELTDGAATILEVGMNQRVVIEQFGEVFAIRKSRTDDEGALLDKHLNFSMGAAHQAMGGVKQSDEGTFYTVYEVAEEPTEAEIEDGEVVNVYILTKIEDKFAAKRNSKED